MKYYFRGLLILEYDPKMDKTIMYNEFNVCKFINDDYRLLAEFFEKIRKYRMKEIELADLINIEVN